MEHRLCFQHGPRGIDAQKGGVSTAPKLTFQEAREKALTMTADEYRQLAGIDGESAIGRMMQPYIEDPQKLQEMALMRLTTSHQRTTETARMFTEQLAGIEERLRATLGKTEYDRIIPIIRALKTPITKNNTGKHLYAHKDGGINFDSLEKSRKEVQTFADAFPLAQAELLTVDQALDILRVQDIRYEVREFQNAKKDNKFDKMINDVGGKTIVFALIAVAFITGVPAIVEAVRTGKVEFKRVVPPLLALAVMGFIASPQLRRQIFSSAEQNTMTDIDAVLNNPAFRQLIEQYDIRGDRWARIARTIMEKPADTKAYLAKVKANGNRSQGIEKETEKFVKSITSGPDERETLRVMIADGRFADFVHMLGGTTTADSRTVIADYIKLGSQQSLVHMRNDARQVNQAAGQ
jgi:hypothetical protein